MNKIYLLANDQGFIRNIEESIDKANSQVIKPAIAANSFYSYACQFNPEICIIHSSYIGNYYQLLDMLNANSKCIVIYCTNMLEYGNVFNLVNSINFYMLDENRLSGINEIIELMLRDLKIFSSVDTELHRLREKIEEERMVKKAKILLMKLGLKEEEAYSSIIKKSMDERISKLNAAKLIIESL